MTHKRIENICLYVRMQKDSSVLSKINVFDTPTPKISEHPWIVCIRSEAWISGIFTGAQGIGSTSTAVIQADMHELFWTLHSNALLLAAKHMAQACLQEVSMPSCHTVYVYYTSAICQANWVNWINPSVLAPGISQEIVWRKVLWVLSKELGALL